MTFTTTINATVKSQATLTSFRWYTGAFKEKSVGSLRAVSRALKNFITMENTA